LSQELQSCGLSTADPRFSWSELLLAETASDRLGPGGAAVREHENELVASKSGRDILGARSAAQDVAGGHQDCVAASMAVGVVYDLEMVEVDG